MSDKLNVWYEGGLRFSCTECGKCCTGAPGAVWLTEEEAENIAAFLGISKSEFAIKYLRRVDGRLSLNEEGNDYDCVFLKENRCTIYPVRPEQCRTFPWWASNLESKEAWQRAAKNCEGINESARLVPLEEIQKHVP